MAKFDIEFKKIVLAEGGYVDDPDDNGGETYLGITRKNHPNLKMWDIIDDIKKKYGVKGINSRLKSNTKIIDEVKKIYKTKYWDAMDLDDIPNQKIAHQLFDTAVNMGVKTAINITQQLVGMTRTGKWSEELLYNLKRL